jgi:hypothetical protein
MNDFDVVTGPAPGLVPGTMRSEKAAQQMPHEEKPETSSTPLHPSPLRPMGGPMGGEGAD